MNNTLRTLLLEWQERELPEVLPREQSLSNPGAIGLLPNKAVAVTGFRRVGKTYLQGKVNVEAVKNVSLNIHQGDFAVLCGPSGSGKTSLLNMIGGLDVPSSGRVWVDGVDVACLDATGLSAVRKILFGFVLNGFH